MIVIFPCQKPKNLNRHSSLLKESTLTVQFFKKKLNRDLSSLVNSLIKAFLKLKTNNHN